MADDRVKLGSIIGPKYWLAWLGLLLLRLAIMLPFSVQVWLGRQIGRLLAKLVKKRAAIARANIRHCFPQLSEADQQALVVKHFEALGIALFETGLCWWGSRRKLERLIQRADGLDYLAQAQQQAKEQGGGVILLSAHFTTLEIGARLLALQNTFSPVYRRMNSPIQEYFTAKGRTKGSEDGAIPHTQMKAIVRHLKKGGTIWFASDQQHQGGNSALVNFLGKPAHSATGTSTLAKLGRSIVVPYFSRRVENGYEIELLKPLDNFPSGDDAADTARYHRLIEAQVKRVPEQYLWTHRRFKGAPGEPYSSRS